MNDLFSTDFRAALSDLCNQVGWKTCAAELREDMTADDAAKWLHNCLDPARAQKLDIDQIETLLRIGRRHNCHVAMQALGEGCGYRVEAIDIDSERDRTHADIAAMMAAVSEKLERLERLQKVCR